MTWGFYALSLYYFYGIKTQCMKQQENKCCKQFTGLLQRTFVLAAIGLSNKQIVSLLCSRGYKTNETAIIKHRVRINDFYRNANDQRCMDLSISKAWQSGVMPRLIEKYRGEFGEYIDAFEKHTEIWFENLP